MSGFPKMQPMGGLLPMGCLGYEDDPPVGFPKMAPMGALLPLAWIDWNDEPKPPVYDGATVLEAFQAWWQAQATLKALLAPYKNSGRLWHLEADEGQDPPFAVYFLLSEAESEPRTTGYACLTATIQVNVHAATDAEAVSIRKAIRSAVLDARLSVDGLSVRHVLPTNQFTTIGEGFLRDGKDSSVASLEIEIPYEVDYGA